MPTITFGGVGSGIDTEAIVSGLIRASTGGLTRVQSQRSSVQSAVTAMSDIGSLMAKFKDSLLALDTVQDVGSFKVSSDSESLAATANGSARPGSFQISVSQLASAYKSYSNALGVSQSNADLGQSGTLTLAVGEESVDLTIEATDSLDEVIAKINGSGLRVGASSFYDGNAFRVQLRGLDSGLESDVTVTEGGTTFGFNDIIGGKPNTQSNGQDAQLKVDGFDVTSKTNQVVGVISGVTLALTKTIDEAEPATLSIDSDPAGFQTKLQTLVDSYNAVINRIHREAGFGSIKAANAELSGDSALRSITNRLGATLTQTVGTGKYQTLGSIGIQLNNNGTLKLNTAKLNSALADDADAVVRVIAGDDDTVDGLADILGDIATNLISANGTIQGRKDGLDAKQRLLRDRVDIEQSRLDRMEQQLRKQFTQMDQVVAANQAQMSFLLNR